MKANKEIDKGFRKECLAVWRDIITGTPIDEGTLKANWQIGINEQNGKELEPMGEIEQANYGKETIAPLRVQQTCILYNNMPYAEVVENGLAGTARIPARMMALAVMAAEARKK